MGRSPCCSKEGLNRGAWTALEDKILASYIKAHGEGKWRDLPKRAGLKRCGKSCRLRWLNYLRPDIKRGNISHDEEELIIRLHKLLGNRWSLIAGRLPGRTDNEIKNYWNTTLGKKAKAQSTSSAQSKKTTPIKCTPKKFVSQLIATRQSNSSPQTAQVMHFRAVGGCKSPPAALPTNQRTFTSHPPMNQPSDFIVNTTDFSTYPHGPQWMNFDCNHFQPSGGDVHVDPDDYDQSLYVPRQSLTSDQPMFRDWVKGSTLLDEDNATLDFDSLASFLDSGEEWICCK